MSTQPIGLLFRCPGIHGSGCPDKATMAFAIGLRVRDGMSFHLLEKTVKKAGWGLAALRLPQPDGQVVAAVEPVCGDCEKRIVQDMVDSSGGMTDAASLSYIRCILGSEIPS